jgi:hypothetical protein
MVSPNMNKMANIIQTKSLVVYHQNIRSIKDKKEELVIFLNNECNKPDIVCISEHHLSVNELFSFYMLEYKIATICVLFLSEVSCIFISVPVGLTYKCAILYFK